MMKELIMKSVITSNNINHCNSSILKKYYKSLASISLLIIKKGFFDKQTIFEILSTQSKKNNNYTNL